MAEEVVLLDTKKVSRDVIEVTTVRVSWWKRNGLLAQACIGTGILLLVCVAFLLLAYLPHPKKSVVVIISLDGFRWDYIDMYPNASQNLRRLADQGVRAEYLKPIFQSKTFPNHYTIVTGLYSENHGIVSNTMFDPVFNATYKISDPKAVTDGRWYYGEPIWVTAEKQGKKAACYFWPGSEAEIKGRRPSVYEKYDESVPYSNRVNTVAEWLLPGPNSNSIAFDIVTLYFAAVDTAGHIFGPDSPEVEAAIQKVDEAIGNLTQLTQNSVNNINYIIVSDHGMTDISSERVILLDDYISLADVDVIDWSPNAFILPKNNTNQSVDNIYQKLIGVPHLSVYLKQNIPLEYHIATSVRMTPIFAMADLGWSISSTRNNASFNGGSHGYDNNFTDMRGTFIAFGPAFKQNIVSPPVLNIDLYELMCKILSISPSSNDGSLANVQHVLR